MPSQPAHFLSDSCSEELTHTDTERMTRISATVIVLLVATLSVLCSDASALSCCRKYTKGQIPMAIIKGYSIQTMTRNCHIDAVIFHTKGGRNICTDLSKTWVMEIIRKLREKVQEISRKHSKA